MRQEVREALNKQKNTSMSSGKMEYVITIESFLLLI